MSSLRERRIAATLNIKPYKRLSSHFTNDSDEISEEGSHSRNPSLYSQVSGELSESESLSVQSTQTSKHIPKKPPKYIFNEIKVILFYKLMTM